VVVVLVFARREWRATLEHLGGADAIQETAIGPSLALSWPAPAGPVNGVVVHPGIGKIAAASAAQFALLTWQPRLVAVLGTCGSISPELKPLDLLLATRTVVYDFTSAVPQANASMLRSQATDLPGDVSLAEMPFPVSPAVLATGDGDPSPAQVERLRRDEGASAVDWESGAVAWVCARDRTPCLILRGVADDATATGAAQLEAYSRNTPLVMERLWAVWEALLATGRVPWL
jgi:adenosylhomocysteine nucleosidase